VYLHFENTDVIFGPHRSALRLLCVHVKDERKAASFTGYILDFTSAAAPHHSAAGGCDGDTELIKH